VGLCTGRTRVDRVPCSSSSANTRCLQEMLGGIIKKLIKKCTVGLPNSKTRRSLHQYPNHEKNHQIVGYGCCDGKVQVRVRCCIDRVLQSGRISQLYITSHYGNLKIKTLIFIQSARTFASAQRFVRGGRIAVEPNMIMSISYASW